MENLRRGLILLCFSICFRENVSDHNFTKNTPSLKQFLLHQNFAPDELACTEVRSWITVTSAVTIDGDDVETHPDWRDFEAIHCTNERASCQGMDLTTFQSTCKTSVSYQPAMVRRIGVNEGFNIKLIKLSGSCSCWIENEEERQHVS